MQDEPSGFAWNDGSEGGCWRDGRFVVLATGVSIPDRCIKCNERAVTKLRKRLHWHHPAMYLVLLAGGLPYLLVRLFLIERVVVRTPLCDEHVHRYQMVKRSVWVLFGLGTALMVAGFYLDSGAVLSIASLSIVGWLISALVLSNLPIRPRYIDRTGVQFGGAGERFLESLPVYGRRGAPGG